MTEEQMYRVVIDNADGETVTLANGSEANVRKAFRRASVTLRKLSWNLRILDPKGKVVERA